MSTMYQHGHFGLSGSQVLFYTPVLPNSRVTSPHTSQAIYQKTVAGPGRFPGCEEWGEVYIKFCSNTICRLVFLEVDLLMEPPLSCMMYDGDLGVSEIADNLLGVSMLKTFISIYIYVYI